MLCAGAASAAAIKRGEVAKDLEGCMCIFLICVWQLCSVIRSAPHNCITSSAAAFTSLMAQRAHVPQSLHARLLPPAHVSRAHTKTHGELCVMPTFGSSLPAHIPNIPNRVCYLAQTTPAAAFCASLTPARAKRNSMSFCLANLWPDISFATLSKMLKII